MLTSKGTDHHLMNDDDGTDPPSSEVPCSICLDSVSDNGDRSRAKLQCGHQFHLDCIGSAFNMKGAMQCPNCRKVEKGRWLYANGSARPLSEFSMDDWFPEEDPYDLSYTEMPFRVHWCPFGRLAQVLSSFEEVEFPSARYNGQQGHHAVFTEHSVSSSVANSYVPYFGPIPPSSLNSSNNVDDFNFNRQWNGLSGQNEILDPHRISAIDIQYNSWGYHSPPLPQSSSHVNGMNPASVPPTILRSTPNEDAISMFGPFSHPFHVGHGSGPRAGSSFISSIAPRHPGNRWNQERMHIPHGITQQEQPSNSQGMPSTSVRRFDGQMGVRPVMSVPSQPDRSGGFYIFPPSSSGQNQREAENPLPNHIYGWERDRLSRISTATYERDSSLGSFHQGHQGTGRADFGNRSSSNFWHRR